MLKSYSQEDSSEERITWDDSCETASLSKSGPLQSIDSEMSPRRPTEHKNPMIISSLSERDFNADSSDSDVVVERSPGRTNINAINSEDLLSLDLLPSLEDEVPSVNIKPSLNSKSRRGRKNLRSSHQSKPVHSLNSPQHPPEHTGCESGNTGRQTRNSTSSEKEIQSNTSSSEGSLLRRSSRRRASNPSSNHSLLNEVCGPETQRLEDISLADSEYLPSIEEIQVEFFLFLTPS